MNKSSERKKQSCSPDLDLTTKRLMFGNLSLDCRSGILGTLESKVESLQ